MAESLASKYRPQTLEDMVSQDSIVKILNRQLQLGEVHNTYLFCGASGCGKTTAARAFAAKLNEVPYQKTMPGVIEIDAASNNGVDNVREIVKEAMQRSIQSKYKVYIIDECHSLTNQSWQAFLKCIEEPPEHTIFIFCTTDPQKIPATILNRCMRFNFTRIPNEKVYRRLCHICECENYTNYTDTCDYISRICGGGMRDAISLLEKCAAYDTDLVIENCLNALGNFSHVTFFDLINAIIDGNEKSVIEITQEVYDSGADIKNFVSQFLDFCLDMSKYLICGTYEVTKIPSNYISNMQNATNFENAGKYYDYVTTNILNLYNQLKECSSPLNIATVNLLRVARCQ